MTHTQGMYYNSSCYFSSQLSFVYRYNTTTAQPDLLLILLLMEKFYSIFLRCGSLGGFYMRTKEYLPLVFVLKIMLVL